MDPELKVQRSGRVKNLSEQVRVLWEMELCNFWLCRF